MKPYRVALIASVAFALGAAMAFTAHEDAVAFGARPAIAEAALSPDGTRVSFVAPSAGQASILYTLSATEGSTPTAALAVSGKPDRLSACGWVSEARLVCTVWGLVKPPDYTRPLGYRRKFAVDAAGGNQLMLNTQQLNASEALLDGGAVVDWLPEEDGKILITRYVQRTDVTGTQIGSDRQGLALEQVDTRTGRRQVVETPRLDGDSFITDGHGHVRILGFQALNRATFQASGIYRYSYRTERGRDLAPFSIYDAQARTGFLPVAVDARRNLAYGLEKKDGRYAVFTKTLDAAGTEAVLLARPDVDVDGLVRIGRDQRVVGASYATDQRRIVYFDPEVRDVAAALHRALPGAPTIDVVDASLDDRKWLIAASSDTDPGRYYLFDRPNRKLQLLMDVRPQLAGRQLGTVKAITYPAADGTPIPAYLTLPPGGATKGLPAIVLPHGGPSARDEWGFDWLSQFFVARGYAVLQPQFRGSSGYGDAWFRDQGFKKWQVAIGDVDQAGKWLIAQGIADAKRLAIVGWSYGGYAALQSAVFEPGLFKAVVAVAPVTDLAMLKQDGLYWSDYRLTADFIGQGAHIAAGSPAANARAIKVPVLLFHGTLDANVSYSQSASMQQRLKAAGGKVELVTFDGLDHQLEDGTARAQMLEKSDAFIRAAIGG